MKPFYKSKTFWGLTISGLTPAITNIFGIDIKTGIDLIKDINTGVIDHYNFIQWLEITGQCIGYFLTIYGTINKNRSPLTIK